MIDTCFDINYIGTYRKIAELHNFVPWADVLAEMVPVLIYDVNLSARRYAI